MEELRAAVDQPWIGIINKLVARGYTRRGKGVPRAH